MDTKAALSTEELRRLVEERDRYREALEEVARRIRIGPWDPVALGRMHAVTYRALTQDSQ